MSREGFFSGGVWGKLEFEARFIYKVFCVGDIQQHRACNSKLLQRSANQIEAPYFYNQAVRSCSCIPV